MSERKYRDMLQMCGLQTTGTIKKNILTLILFYLFIYLYIVFNYVQSQEIIEFCVETFLLVYFKKILTLILLYLFIYLFILFSYTKPQWFIKNN